MMSVLQLETAVRRREAAIGAEMKQRGYQSLIDVQRRQLVKLFEQIGSLRHYLRQQWNRLRRPLSHEGAELRSAQKHCLRFFRRARVRDVVTIRGQSFTSERLPRRRDDGNESASDFDLVSQNDVAIENDEDAVCRGAALLKLKSRRPVCFRAVCADGRYFVRSET